MIQPALDETDARKRRKQERIPMHNDGNEVHVSETEASGGSKEGVVRWVLVVSTLAAVVLLSAIWIFGAATQGDVEEEATVSGTIEAATDEDEGNQTDSIIGEDVTEMESPGEEPETPLDTIEN
ncbi:hypothetical protein Q9K01_03695 [Qipengyuania sp. DY56-A-20]|uniref:Uncharacterized protein n=1 Tax=Qipengyuania benthica TaxID=3067651 RepID=A0ABT9H5Y9_9SPHN|nr:hypothetical protein [Qipengyuania sp. DY56-A-20]MBU1254732.1 hypothetical protein [Alphaproteobacteria bacterium]MBU1606269.1 hypothetical protein [Alphaproteobacteria bacterium]MDP4538723.1 hypothetical protein [Qipengyuania sp. DY56-A-20]